MFVILNEDVFENLDLIEEISTKLSSVDNVASVSSPSRPFGAKLQIPLDSYQKSFDDLPKEMKESISILGSDGLRDFESLEIIDPVQLALIATSYDLISNSGQVARFEAVSYTHLTLPTNREV